MAYIPKGRYLTVEQYRQKMGFASRKYVTDAVRQGRLEGIWLDKRTLIIPEDAIMTNALIKSGKYIGVRAWIRGEIEHQEEVKDWERKQEALRKHRREDQTK